MRGVLRILLFVVVGPFIGLLAMSVLIGTYTLILSGSTRDYAFGPDLFAPGSHRSSSPAAGPAGPAGC